MWRYVRLYAYFLRFSFSRAFEFRIDFWFRVIMDTIYYGVNIAFYKIIYDHTALLGGWSEEQVMVFVAAFLVVDAIYMTVAANNMWWLPYFVNRGDLDYYLIRPVSSLFFLTLRDFAANSFVNLIGAAAILVWALSSYSQPIDPSALVLFLVLLINGAFLYSVISLLSLLPVFWTHSARGLQNLLWSLQRFMERPDGIFYGWVRRVLVSILPFSVIASFPARFFLEGWSSWELVLHAFGISALLFSLALVVWRYALRAYSSASS